jgi:hypothetical protein
MPDSWAIERSLWRGRVDAWRKPKVVQPGDPDHPAETLRKLQGVDLAAGQDYSVTRLPDGSAFFVGDVRSEAVRLMERVGAIIDRAGFRGIGAVERAPRCGKLIAKIALGSPRKPREIVCDLPSGHGGRHEGTPARRTIATEPAPAPELTEG